MKTQKGITLIALIITIIVMLILVGVSVSVVLNTGLFKAAQVAAQNTETEKISENELSTGKVTVGEASYNSLEDYIEGVAVLPSGIEKVVEENIPTGWDLAKVTPITDGTDTIPLPKGFRILEVAGKETTVEEGIVIKDNNLGNEFVWVPVDNAASYTEESFGLTEDDTHTNITKYYGNLFGAMANQTDFNAVFTLTDDSSNIQRSIRTYGGFYVGRYETTYDSKDETTRVVSGIGVKPGKNVLQASSIIKAGENTNDSNNPYYYRWWGLYKAQKDMYENNPNVGSLMISSKQWEAIMTHTGYSGATRDESTYKEVNTPELSGSAYKDSNPAEYDETHNIYDLAGNLTEWTMTRWHANLRLYRGGYGYAGGPEDESFGGGSAGDAYGGGAPWVGGRNVGCRTTLYIK